MPLIICSQSSCEISSSMERSGSVVVSLLSLGLLLLLLFLLLSCCLLLLLLLLCLLLECLLLSFSLLLLVVSLGFLLLLLLLPSEVLEEEEEGGAFVVAGLGVAALPSVRCLVGSALGTVLPLTLDSDHSSSTCCFFAALISCSSYGDACDSSCASFFCGASSPNPRSWSDFSFAFSSSCALIGHCHPSAAVSHPAGHQSSVSQRIASYFLPMVSKGKFTHHITFISTSFVSCGARAGWIVHKVVDTIY
ncbi:hypothetical protein E2C01_039475 [Portunus trituberculatus]|uniref:Uncharacterized protein n=1 Tax=Portunus trituberculatus TaxID=210409 RepID=A0A5B7FDR1_PORTR|nr:hypothetical protein [Portunus trituberculatus]